MKIRIKELSRAAGKYIRSIGKYKNYEKYQHRNEAMITLLFRKTADGEIKGFYLDDDRDFRAYHRSTKEPGKIQYSYGFYRNGELIPCGDIQMATAKDLLREGYSSGIYREIA